VMPRGISFLVRRVHIAAFDPDVLDSVEVLRLRVRT
jgi:hypothetical protein